MPELSRFYGIIIRMFVEVGGRHHEAHFHAYYQDEVGIFAIDTVDLIAGALPKRQQRLVEAWAELHRDELLADGNSCNPVEHRSRSLRCREEGFDDTPYLSCDVPQD